MEKELKSIPAAGIVAEFYGPSGDVVAHEIYFDWPQAPIPELGELVVCSSPSFTRLRGGKVTGRVRRRYFDIQRTAAGETQVWVRLEADVCSPLPRCADRARNSLN